MSAPVELAALLLAAERADWGQVVLNLGPPCFHLEPERGAFCLRAERWGGHEDPAGHRFVSLRDLLESLAASVAEGEAAAG